MRNLLWVKYIIALAILMLAGNVYSVVREFVTFGQAGMGIAIDGLFAVVFLALYPWKKARDSQ